MMEAHQLTVFLKFGCLVTLCIDDEDEDESFSSFIVLNFISLNSFESFPGLS